MGGEFAKISNAKLNLDLTILVNNACFRKFPFPNISSANVSNSQTLPNKQSNFCVPGLVVVRHHVVYEQYNNCGFARF